MPISIPEPDGFKLEVDKVLHVLAYCVLAILGCLASRSKKQFILLFAGFFILGVMIEYGQGLSSYRQASLADIVANTLGLLLGAQISAWFIAPKLKQSLQQP